MAARVNKPKTPAAKRRLAASDYFRRQQKSRRERYLAQQAES